MAKLGKKFLLSPPVVVFLLFSHGVTSYTHPDNARRECILRLFGIAVPSIAATAVAPQNANAVISSKACINGEGDGCSDLAGGNELIRSLQEKSAANKEANMLEARMAYYMKNYPDYMAAAGKNLIMKEDGKSFLAVDDSEYSRLIKENKIGLVYPKAMGGRVSDMTIKPIKVLKE